MINWEPGLEKAMSVNGILNYKFRWIDWLEDGETIDSYTITPETGLTVLGDIKADTDTSVIVSVKPTSSSTIAKFTLTCHAVSTDTQAEDRSIIISVEDL